MDALTDFLRPLAHRDDGAQISEYALIFGVVAVALLIIVSPLGNTSAIDWIWRAIQCALAWHCA